MFLHAFGAYFGLAVSLVMSKRDYDHPAIAGLQDSRLEMRCQKKVSSITLNCTYRYTSDLFSYLGTLILWVFWPSFNAYAVFGDGRHRCES